MAERFVPTHDHVRFKDPRTTLVGDDGGVRVWRTEDGDGLGLFVFDRAPDLPSGAAGEEAFVAAYRALFVEPGVDLVDVALTEVDRTRAVRSIVALPQPTGGRMFIGALSVPFRDFAFVFKVQCEEHGLKGVRERTVLERQKKKGLAEETPTGVTGEFEPYAEHLDVEFPNHPLSRLRRTLPRIARYTTLDRTLRRFEPFALPG